MASIRSVLLYLLVCFIFVSYNNDIVRGERLKSKREDIDLDKQLELLNKPAVKSIKSKYGNIYDCVDFYKQPAFDHPLLKNHSFYPQMRPLSIPKLIRQKNIFKISSKGSYIGLKGNGCPSGTVPIRRVTKDDLIREKLHTERYDSEYNVLTTENPGTHYAVIQTSFNPNKTYNGGGTSISVFNPSVSGSQYSSARMKIQNGLESIQVGWTVNPTLYGDNRTRLFTYLNTGQSQCFNTRCPGFVIIDTKIPLDDVLPVSQTSGVISDVKLLIYRDAPVGNWWLVVEDDNTKVGFWPQRIFSNLGNFATSVEWGGEVFSPPDMLSPQMGSGKLPSEEVKHAAFCRVVTTINEKNNLVDAINTKEYKDIDKYETIDWGNAKGIWRHLMYFGGPGGATGK